MKTKILPEYSQMINGKRITIKNVKVNLWIIDGNLEETWPGKSTRRFERAVEKVFPGWYHQFNKDGTHRKNCISCKRYGKLGTKRT